jgi:hypothetical protein
MTSNEVAILKPDPPDKRDLFSKSFKNLPIPESVKFDIDLPRANQKFSTCGPWAVRNMLYMHASLRGNYRDISVADLYWQTRKRMGTLPRDSGTNLRDVFKTLKSAGVIRPCMFASSSDFRQKPPWFLRPRYRIQGYNRINVGDTHTMRRLLYRNMPIVVGIRIPYAFLSDEHINNTGQLPMPDMDPDDSLFTHAVCLSGYNQRGFTFVNSWGSLWGVGGSGFLPNEWLQSQIHCSDIWTLSTLHQ